jgi:hypothetical protein
MDGSQDCVRKIGEGSNDGKFYGAPLNRPKGVTIIAVLTLILALFGLIGLFLIQPMDSILFGIIVPIPVTVIATLISVGIGIYCGIGLLKLKRVARQLYIWLLVYHMVNAALEKGRIMIGGNLPHAPIASYPTFIISNLLGLLIASFLIYYIASRKKYFVN